MQYHLGFWRVQRRVLHVEFDPHLQQAPTFRIFYIIIIAFKTFYGEIYMVSDVVSFIEVLHLIRCEPKTYPSKPTYLCFGIENKNHVKL